MADLPRRDELFARFRAGAIAVPNTRVTPDVIDQEGSDMNLVAAASSIMGEQLVQRLARAVADSFINTAKGRALDRVVFDRIGIARKPAAPAVVTLELSRPTAGAGAGTVDGALPGTGTTTRVTTNTGVVYTLTQPALFGVSELGPISVLAQAEIAGPESQVAPNQQWAFVDTPFDGTITIANPNASAGAALEESDEKYRARARQFFPTIRRGVLGAIEFGLLAVPGIDSAAVTERLDPQGVPACFVEAYILDELGQSNTGLAARAATSLLEYRALGIPVRVIAGTIDFFDVAFSGLTFDTAIIEDTVQAAVDVRSAIISATNNLRPGQLLERAVIISAVKQVPGVILPEGALVDPPADLQPSADNVALRTKRELISLG